MTVAQKEQELFNRWRQSRLEFVPDGIVDEELYLASSPKILFVMKEVNSEGNSDWDLRDFIRDGARPQTWDNVTRWVIGIRRLPEDIQWQELKDITEEQRREQLKSICVMNLKKSPGSHTTNKNELAEAALKDKDFLNEQFYLYNPDLVICGGDVTCDRFQESVQLKYDEKWTITKRGVWFTKFNGNKILVSFVHPEARVDDHLKYYGLVDAVREIFSKTEKLKV
jgi:hypothetical protein